MHNGKDFVSSPNVEIIDIIKNTDKLAFTVSAGDGEKLFFRESFFEFGKDFFTLPGLPNPGWRWSIPYQHSWMNDFGRLKSKLRWEGFCVDERDGSIITFDQAEVAARNTEENFDCQSFKQQPWYRHYDHVTNFGADWDKDGHDPDFHSGAKLYIGTAWWCFMFSSHA